MSLTYIKSQKNQPHLIHDGYEFIKDTKTNSKCIWKCASYKKLKCKSRVHTANEKIIHFQGSHTHAPPIEAITRKKIMEQVRNEAQSSVKATQKIIADMSVSLTVGEVAVLSPVRHISRTIRRHRQKTKVNPTNFNDY